jgi:hypothetical protein
MWHTIFIALHAGTGLIALATGLITMRAGRLFDVYLAALAAMTLFLVLAVIAEWSVIDDGARILFTAFAVLAGFMVWRATRARRIEPGTEPYIEHVGFTLVALSDAFGVITVLNAGAPVWLVVATGVIIAIAGHFALRKAKTKAAGVALLS